MMQAIRARFRTVKADDPSQDADKKPDKDADHSHRRFWLLILALFAVLGEAADTWGGGTWTTDHFGSEVTSLLLAAHANAAALGRALAGDTAPLDDADWTFAGHVMDTEQAYLDKFLQQMRDGAYRGEDGKRDGESVGKRIALYAGRVCGTANEAWTAALDPETEIRWILGVVEDHCSDCLDMEANNPYTAATIPFMPRTGATKCLMNCDCRALTVDGIECFTMPTGDESEEES